ncbi:MAG TPA: hypothetical protein VM368_04725 [Flavisolibacter sp.]|nr:hypothetical protein [Flavisolibacter sp.]
MYTYGLLETGCYYLVQEESDSAIQLIKVNLETDHCMFIQVFADESTTEWRRKTDLIHDIVECLSDELVESWEKHYNNNEESYYEEDEE